MKIREAGRLHDDNPGVPVRVMTIGYQRGTSAPPAGRPGRDPKAGKLGDDPWTGPVDSVMTDDREVPVDSVMTDDHRFGHGSTVSSSAGTPKHFTLFQIHVTHAMTRKLPLHPPGNLVI